jgi:RHS repeat-associated protein
MIKQILKSLRCCVFLFSLPLLFMGRVSAQTVTSYSPTKGSTPVSLAPGSPAGSYALSGFDTLNPYNLSMNFRLPLLQVGGRGQAGYTMTLPIQRHWRVNKTVTDSRIGCEACEEHIVTYSISPNSDWWRPEIGEFGPGMMAARYSGFNLVQGCFSDTRHWQKALTRLTFTTADGTEYEFRDIDHDGAPMDVPSCNQGASRGRVFIRSDGSAATFISDTPIFDSVVPVSADSYFLVSGYMLLRDGTRYRIDEGKVSWIRDRNGNQTRFEPGKIIDPLNREITFSYEYNGIGILLAKQINFRGFNGATRTIRILYDDLGNVFRPANAQHPAETTRTFGQLFPGITDWGENGNNAGDEFFTRVISRVILPDGRSYRFFYNSYAELARVELPTGGAFEYDWSGGVVNMGGSFDTGPNYEIYRELTEKRVYKDGTTLEGRTILGTCSDTLPPGQTCRQIDQVDPGDNNSLMTRVKHFYFGTPGPTGLFKEEIHYPKWNEGKEYKTESFAKNGTTVLHRSETNWVQRTTIPWWVPNSTLFGPEPQNDPRVTSVTTTLPDVNKVSRQEFGYDDALHFNNRSDLYEYDFGNGAPGALVRRTHTTYVTANNYVGTDGLAVYAGTAAHLRSLPLQQWISSDASGQTKRSFTSFEYDNYANDSTHALLTLRSDITGLCTTFNSSGVCANSAPPDYQTRGNLTSVTSYIQAATQTSPATVAMQYDVAGNVVKFLDARSIASQLYYATTIDYSDRFGSPDYEARSDSGAVELNGSPVKHTYAFPTLITNPLGHTTYTQFDYYLGQPVNGEDANGVVASGSFDDSLDRPKQIRRAIGTGAENQTTFAYDDTLRIVTVSNDRDVVDDKLLVSKVEYDQMGRTITQSQSEGGGNYIVIKTEYDALGRPYKTSNPFRPQNESPAWTMQQFDGLGRVLTVTTPDSAVVSTNYSGNTVTVTDQAGKKRKSVTDALGRLTDVYEDPNGVSYQTSYLYDALENLVRVTQDSQQRFFMYDSLKRLIRADNPEQETLSSLSLTDPITSHSNWSVKYEYDNNGNLTSKTDPRGVVTQNSYDSLNRLTTVLYRINGQPDPNTGDIEYLYDNATNGKGRLWLTYRWGTKPSHTAVGEYDAMGGVKQLWNLFGDGVGGWSAGYGISRNYNLAGAVTSQTYPSGHTVSYVYDTAGRTANFTGNLGDGVTRTYASSFLYNARSQVTQELFGTQTPLYHKLQYNIRGQLWDVRVSTNGDVNGSLNRGGFQYFYDSSLGYGTSGPDNNGNVLFTNIYTPEDEQQVKWAITRQRYDYDSLNRLNWVTESFVSYAQPESPQFVENYYYDRWGNLKIGSAQAFDVETTKNRLYAPGDLVLPDSQRRIAYDKAGNQVKDTFTGYGTATFDGDNHIAAIQDKLGGSSTYTYNANAQRVRRVSSNQETWQIYGIDGELVAEYAANAAVGLPQKEYGYRDGQLLITGEASAVQNVTWTNTAGVSANGNSLTKTATTGWGNAGASSTQSIVSGDGYVEVTATEITTARLFGLSHTDADQNWTSINFGIDLDLSGSIYVFESGNNRGNFGPYTTGDKFQVAIVGGVVKYKKNGTVFYTSGVTPTYPLVVDTALHGNACTLSNVVLNTARVQWLVPDHLGTPRIILDQTGAFANVKRHDYLPFGKELLAGTGGRTPAMGYVAGDGVRQQFTKKERDESGLDYFLARYYSSIHGRFISPDEFTGGPDELYYFANNALSNPTFYSDLTMPQSLNKYQYCYNNPLKYVDPDGHDALLITNKDTGETTLVIPVHFTGASATPGLIAEITNRIAQLDTGNSGVKVQVISTSNPIHGVLNTLDLSPGLDFKNYYAGEGVNRIGGNRGHINTNGIGSAGGASHDTLHFAGFKDRYDEKTRDPKLGRRATPQKGYEDNIMGSNAGTKLTSKQIKEARNNGSTKKCTVENGVTKCK